MLTTRLEGDGLVEAGTGRTKTVTFIDEPHMIFSDDSGTFGEAKEEEWMTFFSDPSKNTLALASRIKKNE